MSPTDESDRGLGNAFAALRKAYTEQPPAHLQAFLLAGLRRRRQVRRAQVWVAATAAAALIVLAALLAATRNPFPPPAPKPPVGELHAHISVPLRPPAPKPARPVRVAARRPPKQPKQAAHFNWADGDGFLAIPYAEPLAPSEQIDVYRVELPRATLAHYGLSSLAMPALLSPARAGNAEAPVPAEVAVGSDGVVRAIRFLP